MTAIALHTWTLGARPLGEVLQIARRAGYDSVEVNWQDFQRCREQGLSDGEIAAMVEENGLPIAVVGVEPGWLFADNVDAAPLWEGFRRAADTARALGCTTLMSAVGRNDGPLARAERNMRVAADLAAAAGVSLAIEYNFGHPTLSTLEQVRDLDLAAGSPRCGLVIDTYHLHRAGRGGRGFESVAGAEIFHFQFSDVPATPATTDGVPLDRLPPGQGQVRWLEVLALLFEKRYAGTLSYEAPNPALWSRAPDETAGVGLAAIRRLIRTVQPGE
jgi:sugar phosphate isomerase/epimerase